MSLTKVTYSMIDGAVFNILDYGATGDGSTNDSAAFQNALDAAGANGGGIVFVPMPSVFYKLDTTIEIPNGVVLEGEGYIYNRDPNQKQIVYTGTGAAIVGKEGFNDTGRCRNIGVKRIRIEPNQAGATAIQFAYASSCLIEDVLVYLPEANSVGIHLKAEKSPNGNAGCFYNHIENCRVLGDDSGGEIGYLLSGLEPVGDGKCNANDLYGIRGAQIGTGLKIDNGNGNRVFGITVELFDDAVVFDGVSSWNDVYGLYVEVIKNFAVLATANTEFNTVFCNVITVGGGGGSRFSLDGNRNTAVFEGRSESSGTFATRANAKLVSTARPMIINQNVAGTVISGVTNTGAPYLTFDSVQTVGAAGIEINPTTYQIWRLSFTDTPGAGTITVPATDGVDGQRLLLQLAQDVTGGHTVTQASFASNFSFAGNSYTLGTGSGERDILEFVRINSKWREVSRSQGIPS